MSDYNLQGKINLIKEAKDDIKEAIEGKIADSLGEDSYTISGNITTYANEIGKIVTPNNETISTIVENGIYRYNDASYTGFDNITVNVNQSVQDKTININGTYTADSGYIGLGEVVVDVEPPALTTKTITQNGIYNASDDETYGYDKVVVNVDKKYLVQVIDYDGTVLKSEVLDEGNVFTLPNNPSHSGLTFQEWSSPVEIEDNTITVEKSDVTIGAVYTTASGLNEFDITLTKRTGLTVTFNMNGTKNWGDGISDTSTSHTYSDYGNYTITCNGTTITTTTGSGIFGQSSTNVARYICTGARFGNVTSISNYTFRHCYSLEKVTLSNSVSTLGQLAFAGCFSLKSIVIPKNVLTLSTNIFNDCQSLQSVVIPNGLLNINNGAFYNCFPLQTITIPNSVTLIEDFAFSYCSSLSSIYLPSSIETLGESIFANCLSLKSAIIECSLLGDNMFQECYGLSKVSILSNITKIPFSAFYFCYCLKFINIPNSVTNIVESAFNYCYSLQSITIPDGVTNLGIRTFYHCGSLTSLKIPKNISTIGSETFYNCYSIKEYDFSEYTSVPTLSNINAFNSINGICQIKVPSSLESSWKTATNWSTYANYIVGV